jgi:MEMO1 family protein
MMLREPIVSGQFYPGSREQCLTELRRCMPDRIDATTLPERIVGGIVPHAGWTYSGSTAARVLAAIAARRTPATVVLLGADHSGATRTAALFASGRWASPVGEVDVDQRLAEWLGSLTSLITNDPHAHDREHSIEVQIPFVRHLWPDAKIVPIIVASTSKAVQVGNAIGRAIETYAADAVVVGSSDLTHYGPTYGFAPKGIGPDALAWAKEVNDRRLIDLILAMDAEAVVPRAAADRSACGAGAIAATVAACRHLGAARGTLLEHTTSYDVARRSSREAATLAVGYVAVVFGTAPQNPSPR